MFCCWTTHFRTYVFVSIVSVLCHQRATSLPEYCFFEEPKLTFPRCHSRTNLGFAIYVRLYRTYDFSYVSYLWAKEVHVTVLKIKGDVKWKIGVNFILHYKFIYMFLDITYTFNRRVSLVVDRLPDTVDIGVRSTVVTDPSR